jgi:hypothetical protein
MVARGVCGHTAYVFSWVYLHTWLKDKRSMLCTPPMARRVCCGHRRRRIDWIRHWPGSWRCCRHWQERSEVGGDHGCKVRAVVRWDVQQISALPAQCGRRRRTRKTAAAAAGDARETCEAKPLRLELENFVSLSMGEENISGGRR